MVRAMDVDDMLVSINMILFILPMKYMIWCHFRKTKSFDLCGLLFWLRMIMNFHVFHEFQTVKLWVHWMHPLMEVWPVCFWGNVSLIQVSQCFPGAGHGCFYFQVGQPQVWNAIFVMLLKAKGTQYEALVLMSNWRLGWCWSVSPLCVASQNTLASTVT